MVDPDTSAVLKPRHGRPPKIDHQSDDTRQALIRSDLEVLAGTDYLVAGIETIIGSINVPRGPFYRYFKDRETFNLAVLSAYGDLFTHKLDESLLDDAVPPLERMTTFIRHVGQGAERYQFCRGCLVGSLLQEAPLLPDTFPGRLKTILTTRESHMACCLHGTRAVGTIACDASPDALAQVFWIGREGVVVRARLRQSVAPLNQYWEFFVHSMIIETPARDGVSVDNPLPTRDILS